MALTIKQDRFAHYYVELGNASEAYRRAYDAGGMSLEAIGQEAHALTRHPQISLKVKELQAATAKAHAVTRESLAEELEEARAAALGADQAAAAVSAIMGKAKLYGLLVDKAEIQTGQKADKPDLAELLAKAKEAGAINGSPGTETAQPTQPKPKALAKTTA